MKAVQGAVNVTTVFKSRGKEIQVSNSTWNVYLHFSLICILRTFNNDKWNYLSLNVVALLVNCLQLIELFLVKQKFFVEALMKNYKMKMIKVSTCSVRSNGCTWLPLKNNNSAQGEQTNVKGKSRSSLRSIHYRTMENISYLFQLKNFIELILIRIINLPILEKVRRKIKRNLRYQGHPTRIQFKTT